MNRQIDEMAKVIEEASCGYGVDGCHRCEFDGREGISCAEMRIAKALYNKGYRKASDVAREIFEEIGRLLDNYHSACLPIGAIEAYCYYEGGLGDEIAELRKKYESEVEG